jgi:catechol 2,3-dioxygenase-like lactoylglutathione lyase family enzyme
MMSTTEQNTATATQVPETKPLDTKLEVVILPVSDAERAKQFYASLGWREDADFIFSEELRVLQFTPPGSQASIIFGTGVKPAAPGSTGRLLLAVDDIDAARAELIERGVDVSEVFHGNAFSDDRQGRVPGADPERQSYGSFASFSDPDGNEWLLQEVTTRLPGRVDEPDVAALAGLLLETALHHDAFEKAAPAHDWWDWYAPYLSAREHGSTPDEASAAADLYMEEAHGVVVSR